MATRRTPPKHRRPHDPGPNYVAIGAVIVVLGLALGAGGTLLAHHKTPARPVRAVAQADRATPTPEHSPRTDILALPPVKHRVVLPASPAPGAVSTSHAHASALPSSTPLPLPSPTPSARASAAPSPSATPAILTPAPVSTASPLPRPHHTRAAAAAVPVVMPSETQLHDEWTPATAAPPHPAKRPRTLAVANPAAAVVHRYLGAIMHGDEPTAYALLGGVPGQKGLSLSEEAFITRDARISGLTTQKDPSGTSVQAEVSTATGLYVVTYRVETRNGRDIITSHDYIKP